MRHTQECRYVQLHSDQQSIFRSNVYYVSPNNSNANNLKQTLSDSQTGLTSILFDFVEKLSKLSRSILYCLSEHIISTIAQLALASQINNVKLYNHNMSFFCRYRCSYYTNSWVIDVFQESICPARRWT